MHHRELSLLLDDDPALAILGRLDGQHRRRIGRARDTTQARLDLPERLVGFEVAHDDQDRVVGVVVRLVEGADLRGRDAPEVLRPADDGVAVRVRLERDGRHFLGQEALGIVFGARAPLLDHDLALGVDLLGVEQQVVHPVRLEVEHEVELVGDEVDVVRSHVLRGERVVLSAVLLYEPGELAGPVVRCALEHHVLEEVGDPGGSAVLVPRADAIPGLDGHDRAAMVLQQQHAQAVLERGRLDAGRGRG